MEQKPKSIRQIKKEELIANRQKSYESYINRYPLYSVLMVLEDYENTSNYEECAIIRDALLEYKRKHVDGLSFKIEFPTHISQYLSKEYQDTLLSLKITIDEELARDKAIIIKTNLPV